MTGTPATRIASHRGGTLEFGDSTPAGFEATARMPVEELEFDVHPTRDGGIIVHHDATLDRTTDRSGEIASLTEAEVRSAVINYGAGGNPLTLQQLCEIYRRSHVDFRCEIKPGANHRPYQDFVPRVLDVLSHEGMLERTGFSSFLIDTQDELAALTTRPRLWLVSPPVLHQLGQKAVTELAAAHDIGEIGVHIDTVNVALTEVARAAGLDFGCYGAHTEPQITKAIAAGVKVFTTDRPSLAVNIRADLTRAGAA